MNPRILFALAVLLFWVHPLPAWGQEGVALRVRTLTAQPPDEKGQEQAPLDSNISDLSSQLEQLPYGRFRLLANDRVEVPVKRKQSLRLRNGQILDLRLLYQSEDRVGIWLLWQDRNGTEILNTRMHFNNNEPMVTGTDGSGDLATILAINLEQ